MPTRLPFFSDCVSWPVGLVPALLWIADNGSEISRGWFMRNVALHPEDREMTEARWWRHGTTYHRLKGAPVFWFENSMTEYVYAQPAAVDALMQERDA